MSAKDETPKCCCCCNVRVGSYLLASLVLAGGIFTVISASLLLANVLQQDYIDCTSQGYEYMCGRSAQWLSLGTGFCLVLIASLAIYGLITNRGTYLIPLFFMQIFSFLCSVVYIGTVMFYWPTVKDYIFQCQHMSEEWKEWFGNLDDAWLAVIVFGLLLFGLSLKGFFVSVIYRCYKHLMLQSLRQVQRDPEINSVSKEKAEEASIYNPPKYEDIQKVPLVYDVDEPDTKPPPYSS